MVVQARVNLTTADFIRSGRVRVRNGQTLLTDAGRSGDLAPFTLMAYNPTSKKWVPFTDETATTGEQYPTGISIFTVTEAAIKAGDVTDFYVYSGGDFSFDQNMLVIENSKTLDTIINVPANSNTSVKEYLAKLGMHPVDVLAGDGYENA